MDPMITRQHMPLPNVNMPRLLLFWLVIIVLLHCRASPPALQPALPRGLAAGPSGDGATDEAVETPAGGLRR